MLELRRGCYVEAHGEVWRVTSDQRQGGGAVGEFVLARRLIEDPYDPLRIDGDDLPLEGEEEPLQTSSVTRAWAEVGDIPSGEQLVKQEGERARARARELLQSGGRDA